MDSNTIIISLIYYIGIASCAAQGAEKGKDKNNISILYYIINSFGGGLMRDTILLKVHPWLFTVSALYDIIVVVVIGYLYSYYFFICKADKKWYDIAMKFVAITDILGLGSFICIGMDKAFDYSDNIFIIVASGYITAVGGGILASEKTIMKVFDNRNTICYHFITLSACCYYYAFRNSLWLVYFIVITFFLANNDYRILYNHYSYNLINPCFDVFLLYPAICNKDNNVQRKNIIKNMNKFSIYPKCSKIYIVQQRIRQC